MILRSGKVVIKSPKSANIREDFISKLHDALLIQILTLLPKPDVNQTRYLSKRWKNVWKFLPNLYFITPSMCSTEQINKFHDSVDQTLALRAGMPIQKFNLLCTMNSDYNRVYDWMCGVAQCKVQELELQLAVGFEDDRHRVRFCWDLFKTCSSLVSLTLRGEFVLDVPDGELHFPCLKKIDLIAIVYSGDESFANLITGCPVLEELYVERYMQGRTDNMKTCMVSSLSLKRLRLLFVQDVMGKAVIDAPKLEYLHVSDQRSSGYSMTKPLSLIEARIQTRYDDVESVDQLMACLSSAKILDLASSTMVAVSTIDGLNMPVFPNLIKLSVGIEVFWGWDILPTLLNSMPNLEHLTFSNGLRPFPHTLHTFRMRWVPGPEVPACLRFKMKEIIINNRETITPQEFDMIGYLLKHSENLEILTINAHEIDAGRREELLNFHRGSESCRIRFV